MNNKGRTPIIVLINKILNTHMYIYIYKKKQIVSFRISKIIFYFKICSLQTFPRLSLEVSRQGIVLFI